MTESHGIQYPLFESEGPTVEDEAGSDDWGAGPELEPTPTRSSPSVEAIAQADGVQADGIQTDWDGPGFQQNPTYPEPMTSTAEETAGADPVASTSRQGTAEWRPTNSNVVASEEPGAGWTSLDRELLDAAAENPANMLDLIKRGANVGVISASGMPLLVSLVKSALDSKWTETVLQVLQEVLVRMTKEQINATDGETTTALIWAIRGYSSGNGEIAAALTWGIRDYYSANFVRARVDIIERLFEYHADPEVKDEDGCTALDWACRRGYTSIVKLLLDKGADFNVEDNSSWTPLKTAARFGHTDTVKMLLGKGAMADVPDNMGWTALTCAARYDFANIVQVLLANGADPNLRNRNGRTALSYASRHGFEKSVMALLEEGADPNIPDGEGWTPLAHASRNNFVGVVRALLDTRAKPDISSKKKMFPLALGAPLDNRADPNIPTKEGWTPLASASRYGFVDVARALLDRGADPNIPNREKWTPLASACKWGNESIVARLLEANADVQAADDSGPTALHSAAVYGHNTIVKRLLEYGADMKSVDERGETPLHMAARQGYATVVKTLLEHQPLATGINAQDGDLETPLHSASLYTYEDVILLFDDEARCDTDAHCETRTGDDAPGRFQRVNELLYEHRADLAIMAGEDETALHMAARHNTDDRVKALLGSKNKHHFTLRNKHGKTALHVAAEGKNPDAVRQLLASLKFTDWGTRNIEEQTLLRAAKTETTHDIVGMILRYCGRPQINHVSVEADWPALVLAAYHGEDRVLLELLQSASPHPGDNKKRKTAKTVVKKIIKVIETDAPAQKNTAGRCGSVHLGNLEVSSTAERDGDKGVKILTGNREAGEGDQITKAPDSDGEKAGGMPGSHQPRSPKAKIARTRADYDRVLDILLNPPRVATSLGRAPYEKPQLGKPLDLPRLDACVIEFYAAQDGGSGFLRRFRDVRDVVYGDGPKKIMESARGAIQNPGEAHASQDSTFRWIHLPANNLQWMNDLALRIFIDEEEEQEEYEDLRVFLRDSWHEVLDGSVTSRYMKPSCSSRLGKKWEGESPKPSRGMHAEANSRARGALGRFGAAGLGAGSEAGSDETDEKTSSDEILDSKKPKQQAHDNKCQIALYMPYITFAIQRENDATSGEYDKLLKCYENQNVVIHGSKTLDEFYYHFEEDNKSEEERRRRNKDQVVTMELNEGVDIGKCESWTILRVDQLWLWVINEKYIITSSTHRVDDADDIVPSTILSYLSKDPLGKRARPQPASAVAMSKFIVDFCVGFFGHLQADAGPKVEKAEGRRSTRQLFSDAINRASIEEALLFRKFTERSGNSDSDDRRLESIREAAYLLRTVKDIRDELNILRVIVSHHETVQAKLSVGAAHNDRHAGSVLRDIKELDKVARKIEGAVNATLGLEQSAIAIAQSNEAVQQGRTMMAFTVVTILFLPISFLATLFAVNIDVFQRREDGDLSYTPGWIFPKIFGLSAMVWVPSLVWALYFDETKAYALRLQARLVGWWPKGEGRRIAQALKDANPPPVWLSNRRSTSTAPAAPVPSRAGLRERVREMGFRKEFEDIEAAMSDESAKGTWS